MDDEAKTGKKVGQANGKILDEKVSGLWLEELQQSYEIFKNVLSALPPESQKELIELLRIIAESNKSQETSTWPGKKTLQIVTAACKGDQAPPKTSQYEPERTCERRQGDRRQRTHNFGNPWTAEHIRTLQTLARQKIPLRQIALKLGRTSAAVESKAKELNIPLLQG